MKDYKKKYIIVALICILFFGGIFSIYFFYSNKSNVLSKVIVDKPSLTMYLLNYFGDTIHQFPVAVGTNFGNKGKEGDLKTPEGLFPIESIEDAKDWKYDFDNDGKGPIDGAYGPWFIRLKVSNAKGIGIHGTHANETIGQRVSHGCVRMKNEHLNVLVNLISPGLEVLINPDTVIIK
jgi:lipoprotein-anchoring transpeptidase ErfK/SrfK